MSTKSRKSSWDYMTSGSFMNSSTSTRKLVPNVDDQTQSNKRRTAVVLTNLDDHLIETEEEKLELYSIEDIRLKTKKFMTHSKFGLYYENALLVLSVFSSLEFIYQTYLEQNNEADQNLLDTLNSMEKVLAIIFMIDWSLNYFCADHKLIFVTSFFSMVDILTVVPIWITDKYNRIPDMRDIDNFKTAMLYIAFGLSTTRILRALRIRRKLLYIEDAVDRCLAEICLVISVMLLFNSAVMQFLEVDQDLGFHTWMYYIWVTTTTVGYGDVLAITVLGRMAVMAMIAFAIIIVPKMTNELIEKMNLQSVYARANYFPKSRFSKHIVIIGDLASTSIRDFFAELFHEDHENGDLNAVMLIPDYPTFEMIMLLRSPEYFLSLTYLEGSALVDKDLERAKVNCADAIFVMCNKFSKQADDEDAKSILLTLSIRRFLGTLYAGSNLNLLYVMQLIRPENRLHIVQESLIKDSPARDNFYENSVVLCLDELKMGIVAKALIYPGASTLIMNLITSFAEEDSEASKEADWLTEYKAGCDWEIYVTELSSRFRGVRFCELAWSLYNRLGVVLFGLQVDGELYINPHNYDIPKRQKGQKEARIEAFVIAKNEAESDLSFTNVEEGHWIHSFDPQMDPHRKNSILKKLEALNRNQPVPPKKPAKEKKGNRGRTESSESHVSSSSASSKDTTEEEEASPKSTGNEDGPSGEADPSLEKLLSPTQAPPTQVPGTTESKWKLLKRDHLLRKAVNTTSWQQRVQLLETKHMRSKFFMRSFPATLDEATITRSLEEDLPFVNNHLIVLGKSLGSLYDLICPLRAKHIGNLRYIIILYPYDIPFEVWQRICNFEAIYVVRGSSLEEKHLQRAGIFRANKVVYLGDGQAGSSGHGARGTEALVDADAIFTYQCVKRLNANVHMVCEIVNHANIAYLDMNKYATQPYIRGEERQREPIESTDFDYQCTPLFAAGTLFTTSLLDSVICQTYYNREIYKVVSKLINGQEKKERKEFVKDAMFQLNNEISGMPPQAKAEDSDSDSDSDISDSTSSGSVDEHDVEHYDNEEQSPEEKEKEKEEREWKNRSKKAFNNLTNSCLYQIPIPTECSGKTYGEMFQHLTCQGMIPLGLHRGVFSNLKVGPLNNSSPYVFTNPGKDAELYACDTVFVLSHTPYQPVKKAQNDVKEWVLELQQVKSHEEFIQKRDVRLNRRPTIASLYSNTDLHMMDTVNQVIGLSQADKNLYQPEDYQMQEALSRQLQMKQDDIQLAVKQTHRELDSKIEEIAAIVKDMRDQQRQERQDKAKVLMKAFAATTATTSVTSTAPAPTFRRASIFTGEPLQFQPQQMSRSQLRPLHAESSNRLESDNDDNDGDSHDDELNELDQRIPQHQHSSKPHSKSMDANESSSRVPGLRSASFGGLGLGGMSPRGGTLSSRKVISYDPMDNDADDDNNNNGSSSNRSNRSDNIDNSDDDHYKGGYNGQGHAHRKVGGGYGRLLAEEQDDSSAGGGGAAGGEEKGGAARPSPAFMMNHGPQKAHQ